MRRTSESRATKRISLQVRPCGRAARTMRRHVLSVRQPGPPLGASEAFEEESVQLLDLRISQAGCRYEYKAVDGR